MKRHNQKRTSVGPLILSRRSFLRVGCCSVATLGITAAMNRFGMMSALASASADYRALVCVFLFGGNDSNNVIVPTDIPRLTQYQQLRGDLALAANTLLARSRCCCRCRRTKIRRPVRGSRRM